MDDSDSDTEAVVPLETEGPFSNFADLKNRTAHLAVFLHYLMSNCDPSSLVFGKISDMEKITGEIGYFLAIFLGHRYFCTWQW